MQCSFWGPPPMSKAGRPTPPVPEKPDATGADGASKSSALPEEGHRIKPRRWRPWGRRQPAVDENGALAEQTTGKRRRRGKREPRHYPWIWRSRWRRWGARVVGWGSVLLAGLVLSLYAAIRLMVKPSDVAAAIKEQVEEQSGGRLEIGSVEFNVLTGLRLSKVNFFPPKLQDRRGSRHGGDVSSLPLLTLGALDVRYSIPKILTGRVHIRAMQLVKPAVHLRQTDGVFNFSSIASYREGRFPPAMPPKEQPAEQPKNKVGPTLLPIDPALIYLPFELLLQNVGIRDLSLDMEIEEKAQTVQRIVAEGVSFDVGVNWLGRNSSIWFSMLSPFEQPLSLIITKSGPKGAGALQQTLAAKVALNLKFEIENLKKVNFDVATRLIKLATPAAGFNDLGAFVKLRIALGDDLRSINIETLNISIAEAFQYALRGKIGIGDAGMQSFNLLLTQSLGIDLKSAANLAKPFFPELRAGGTVSADDLKIEGIIEPQKLATVAATGSGLPTVAGVIWIEDAFANLPQTGISMDPISGAISLAVGSALSGEGSQVDLGIDLDVPRVEAKKSVEKFGAVSAGAHGLSTKLTARVLWPEMLAQVFKVDIEADHIRASGDHLPKIDVPLRVKIDAEGGKDLGQVSVISNVELEELLEFNATAECQSACERLRANVAARLPSLAKLHAIAVPVGSIMGVSGMMPTKLEGAFDFQFNARGKLPPPLKTPLNELISKADVHFNTQMSLTKVDLKIPILDVDLRRFETRLLAAGGILEQKIELTQKFETLALTTQAKPGANPIKANLERFAFEINVENHLSAPPAMNAPNPMEILRTTNTKMDTKLFLGRLTVPQVLPRPIADFQTGATLEQVHLQDIKLEDLSVRLPDYGTQMNLKAVTTLGADFLPKKFQSDVSVQAAHNGDEKLPMGIKTSGKINFRLATSTADMLHVTVDGETAFDQFNITIPAKDNKSPALLELEGMTGQIPFRQNVIVPQLAKIGKPTTSEVATGKTDDLKAPKEANAGAPTGGDVPLVDISEHGADDAPGPSGLEKGLSQQVGTYFEKNDDPLAAGSNTVALVDYGNVRPFYPDRRPVGIKRMVAANLELSNMEFDVELRQNWFALNQFVIGFLGGKIQGDFQLAFDPNATNPKGIPRRLRTSVHVTRLDTRKLIERFPSLAGKANTWDPFANPYIDATVHLTFDLKSNDLGGGVEITSIGKEQLKMMLYYADPFEQNATIGDIRKALALGECRHVSIPLRNGEVGLDVDVRVLGAPLPTPKLAHFPISQILDNFKDQGGSSALTPAAKEPSPKAAEKPEPGTAKPSGGAKAAAIYRNGGGRWASRCRDSVRCS